MREKTDIQPPNALRMTRQRRVILEQLGPGRHLTADAVYEGARRRIPTISMATVYRSLEYLAATGVIRKLHPGGGQMQFDGGTHPHYHVRCLQCGRVGDISSNGFPDINVLAGKATDFAIVGHELTFQGVCIGCRAGAGRPGERLIDGPDH